MSPAVLVAAFAGIFLISLLSVWAAMRFADSRRQRQVERVVGGADLVPSDPVTPILRTASGPEPARLTQKLNAQIREAGVDWSVGHLLTITAALALAGGIIGLRLNPLFYPGLSAAALEAGLGALPYLMLRKKRRKRLQQFEEQFPEALDFLARSMRAGHAFTISLEMLSEESPQPLGKEFRQLFNEHNLGAPLETALRNLSSRVPLLDVRFFVSAVLLQAETGGNLSEILTRLAVVIRERFRLRGQVKAASAHGRVTGLILTVMPLALVAALSVIAPDYLKGMVADPDGRNLVIGALAGQLLGYFAIRKIVNIEV